MTPTPTWRSSGWACASNEALGLGRVRLLINSLGDSESRPGYEDALAGYLQSRRVELSDQARVTLERNPLRVLDSKRAQDQPVIAEAPLMADFLSGASAEHFAAVRGGLDILGAAYEVSPRLVRGLDYYTRTTFEFVADALDTAQNAVGGGGRYDGLVEELGGPATPGIGFALGVDRILLACDAEGAFTEAPAPVRGVRGGRRRRAERGGAVRPAPAGRAGRGPGLRRPLHEGPDEAGRPLRGHRRGDRRARRAGQRARPPCATCAPAAASNRCPMQKWRRP